MGEAPMPRERIKLPLFGDFRALVALLRRRRNGVFLRRRSDNSRGPFRLTKRYRLPARRRGFARWRGGGLLRRWRFFGLREFGGFLAKFFERRRPVLHRPRGRKLFRRECYWALRCGDYHWSDKSCRPGARQPWPFADVWCGRDRRRSRRGRGVFPWLADAAPEGRFP